MSKLLFWAVVILVLLLVSRLAGRAAARHREIRRQQRDPMPKPPPRATSMVQCAHCGVHLPAHEALRSQGTTWCSAEHARLGPRPPQG